MIEDLRELLRSGDGADFVVEVGERTFDLHIFVLRLSSGYFRHLFESSDAETQGRCMVDRDPGIFELLLPFLYCRRLDDISSLSAGELYDLFVLADFMQVRDFDKYMDGKHRSLYICFLGREGGSKYCSR